MAADLGSLLADLQAESDDLDATLGGADEATLSTPTPAAGWSVADTIGHLWYFDRAGRQALQDPDGFLVHLAEVMANPAGFMADHLAEVRRLGESMLPAWHEERRLLIDALGNADPGTRVPWYGPAMSPASFATARLMETWAHGQDIADALGVRRAPTDRLRHVAYLGVRTRAFSYAVRGREMPDVEVHVALIAPSGEQWDWGDPEAADRIAGPALDFCLLVTQRRVLDDLSLSVTGPAALDWMSIAQAFAGADSLTDPTRAGLPVYR